MRLIWGSWCLALIVLVLVYTATLTSLLTAPKYEFLANSIEEVAANPEIQPVVAKGLSLESYIMARLHYEFTAGRFSLIINDIICTEFSFRADESD